MPQLDIVTYSGQVFWLLVVFFVFYTIVIKQVLPMLARILKARQKKLEVSRSNVDGFGAENAETAQSFDNMFISSLQESSSSTREHFNQTTEWVSSNDHEVQMNKLRESNSIFLKSIGKNSLQLNQILTS